MAEVSKEEILNFFEETPKTFENNTLGRVSELSNQVIDLDREIAEQEGTLKTMKEKRRQLTEDLIPAVMTEHGVAEVTLRDGSKVTVKKFYSCTIPADKTERAFEWLRENGHEGLIKHRLTIDFTRDKDDHALQIKKELEDKGLYPGDKEWVEPSTLRGFAREQVESGEELPPDDCFNLFIGERATIK
tara:strand:- start:21935 stop:22498 length:564 start_codon:yes stop_codon:yes gene_type:complete